MQSSTVVESAIIESDCRHHPRCPLYPNCLNKSCHLHLCSSSSNQIADAQLQTTILSHHTHSFSMLNCSRFVRHVNLPNLHRKMPHD